MRLSTEQHSLKRQKSKRRAFCVIVQVTQVATIKFMTDLMMKAVRSWGLSFLESDLRLANQMEPKDLCARTFRLIDDDYAVC